MNCLDGFTSLVSALILLSVLNSGNGLECFTCNVTFVDEHKEEPCKGIATMEKCNNPAVCMSATIFFEDAVSKLKQFTAVKSCYMPFENVCDKFLQNMKTTNPQPGNIGFVGKCYTCSEPGCNTGKEAKKQKEEPSKASITTLSTVLLIIFCCIFRLL